MSKHGHLTVEITTGRGFQHHHRTSQRNRGQFGTQPPCHFRRSRVSELCRPTSIGNRMPETTGSFTPSYLDPTCSCCFVLHQSTKVGGLEPGSCRVLDHRRRTSQAPSTHNQAHRRVKISDPTYLRCSLYSVLGVVLGSVTFDEVGIVKFAVPNVGMSTISYSILRELHRREHH